MNTIVKTTLGVLQDQPGEGIDHKVTVIPTNDTLAQMAAYSLVQEYGWKFDELADTAQVSIYTQEGPCKVQLKAQLSYAMTALEVGRPGTEVSKTAPAWVGAFVAKKRQEYLAGHPMVAPIGHDQSQFIQSVDTFRTAYDSITAQLDELNGDASVLTEAKQTLEKLMAAARARTDMLGGLREKTISTIEDLEREGFNTIPTTISARVTIATYLVQSPDYSGD
jgi:hypothetical protein